MQTKSVVNSFQHEKKTQICNLAWNPAMVTQKEIAFCDCKGYLGLIENATGAAQQSDKASNAVSDSVMDSAVFGADDNDAEISISQIKKATGFITNEEDGLDVFTGVRSSPTGRPFLQTKSAIF